MNGHLSAIMTTIKIEFCHGVDSHYEVDLAALLECFFGGIHKAERILRKLRMGVSLRR